MSAGALIPLVALGVLVLAAAALMVHPRTRRAMKAGAGVLRALATDKRIPRPLRWLLVIAVLPIPGPFEEIVGGLAIGIVAWRYRTVLDEHRHASRGKH